MILNERRKDMKKFKITFANWDSGDTEEEIISVESKEEAYNYGVKEEQHSYKLSLIKVEAVD